MRRRINMHYTRGQFILSLGAIVVGMGLIILTSRFGAFGFISGGFFIVLGLGSLLLTLGSVLPGLAGRVLRNRIFKGVVITVVILMLLLTAYFALNQ